jgi:hypothetical protein
MPFLRTVNLPAPLIVQSVASVGLGVYLAIFGRTPFTYGSYSLLAPSSPSSRTADTVRFFGMVLAGLQSQYLISSYMPLEENQFVATSAPVRMAIGVALGTVAFLKRKTMSESGFWEFVGLAVVELGSAAWIGHMMGRFDGMVPVAQKWL